MAAHIPAVLRHDGFAAFTRRVPEQLICWESEYGWTRRGYGQVPEVAPLPPSARKIHAERAATQALIEQAYQAGRLPSG